MAIQHFTAPARLSALAGLCLIGACSTTYTPPTGGQTATVTFKQRGLVMYRMFANGEDCSSPMQIPPESNVLVNGNAPLTVRAGQEIAFAFLSNTPSLTNQKFCHLTVSFKPEPLQRYELEFLAQPAVCSVTVSRMVGSPGSGDAGRVIEPSARKRTPLVPLLESGKFCAGAG